MVSRFVCGCGCESVCVCLVHVHMCMWRPEKDVESSVLYSTYIPLRPSLTEPGVRLLVSKLQ